jgi:hypothetical protein
MATDGQQVEAQGLQRTSVGGDSESPCCVFAASAAMVAIYVVHYNFARIHKTLRITPAMPLACPIMFES